MMINLSIFEGWITLLSLLNSFSIFLSHINISINQFIRRLFQQINYVPIKRWTFLRDVIWLKHAPRLWIMASVKVLSQIINFYLIQSITQKTEAWSFLKEVDYSFRSNIGFHYQWDHICMTLESGFLESKDLLGLQKSLLFLCLSFYYSY